MGVVGIKDTMKDKKVKKIKPFRFFSESQETSYFYTPLADEKLTYMILESTISEPEMPKIYKSDERVSTNQ